MIIQTNALKINIDKYFTNKKIKTMPFGKKYQIWFSNLELIDYTYFQSIYNDIEIPCGLFDDNTTKIISYKKTLMFIKNENDNKPQLYIFKGSFVSVLERDRCLLSYDSHLLVDDNKTVKNIISKIRKDKIKSILHESKNI